MLFVNQGSDCWVFLFTARNSPLLVRFAGLTALSLCLSQRMTEERYVLLLHPLHVARAFARHRVWALCWHLFMHVGSNLFPLALDRQKLLAVSAKRKACFLTTCWAGRTGLDNDSLCTNHLPRVAGDGISCPVPWVSRLYCSRHDGAIPLQRLMHQNDDLFGRIVVIVCTAILCSGLGMGNEGNYI